MNTISKLRLLAAAGAMLACGHAAASADGPMDVYVTRGGPDIPLSRYQAGELGVVLPSYERVYLYTAWRSVALGIDGLKTAPNPKDGLLDAVGHYRAGWSSDGDSRTVYAAWLAAVTAALKKPPAAPHPNSNVANGSLTCPSVSYAFAAATLGDLARRSDATPARLAAWVASQRQVFKFCGDDPDMPRRGWDEKRPAIPAPAELPASEALYWRQMQQYQLASAAFYDENYALSGSLFARIGATDKHPLRRWGEYLNLRSQARAAYAQSQQAAQAAVQQGPAAVAAQLAIQQQKMAAIQASVDHIVANPDLAALHEASRAIGRSSQARLTPTLRFIELSKLLDDPRADPYVDDHLGDWRVVANEVLQQPYGEQPDKRIALRVTGGLTDWIQTVGQCREYQAKRSCAAEQEHALEQWKRYTAAGDKAQSRVWLMAAAMLSGAMTPELEKASLRVAANAPEYLTLRYALARHYRLGRQADKARAASDAVLAGAVLAAQNSISARNLFLQERFAVASSPSDAAPYLLRSTSRTLDPDTGEVAAGENNFRGADHPDAASDGVRWLDSGLAVEDLQALAANTKLPSAVRARIGVAALMRFDLLAQDEAALKASEQIEQLLPALAPVMQKYRKLAGTPERRYWMQINALKYGLSPMFGNNYNGEFPLRAADDTLATMWCKMPAKAGSDGDLDTGTELAPPMAELGNVAARDRELAQLAALKTATGHIGDIVMQRAVTVPNDPELPWLLYVTVQSTRGGCLDDDARKLSKSAFTLLHKRYKNSDWASKTPYFY
jgi:hypothetical protein